MKRAWFGIALLSGSWLLGLSYYESARLGTCADWAGWRQSLGAADVPLGTTLAGLIGLLTWPTVVLIGALLLTGLRSRIPDRGTALLALVMVVPACWWLPWPYKAGVVALALGLLVALLPLGDGLKRALGGAGLLAGVVLLAQAVALQFYMAGTARARDLPDPLPALLAWVASALDIDAAACGPHVALHTMRRVHMLAATWELLLDPATLGLLVGGLVVLAAAARGLEPGKRLRAWLKATGCLLVCLAVWLPLRAGLLMAALIHRALLVEYEAEFNLMNQFWSPWVLLGLLVPPVLLAWRFVRVPAPAMGTRPTAATDGDLHQRIAATACAFLAVAAFTGAVTWDPIGERKGGRVLIDEHHSDWERTDRPFDTEWYGHLSGYNYACIYDYCSRYYEMARQEEPTTDAVLNQCDVLVVKTPTKPYTPEEVGAIRRFVERGGGLLLIGEHTNVFGTGTYLNQVSRPYGFSFRSDCLFSITGSPFEQYYVPPRVPHPVVQHMPPMDFAVSCSVDTGTSRGRAVILSTGLKNLPADYHASNFYPQVTDRAEARYGAFVQLWGTRHGQGRVLAFTDSTIFSNFSTFEPGKAELVLGMVEWLNHGNRGPDPRPWLGLLGGALAVAAVALAWRWRCGAILVIAAGLLGLTVAGPVIAATQRAAMPGPEQLRPFVRVVIDRTVCDTPLSKGGFIRGEQDGFGIFERWILRLGYFNQRASGAEALTGDLLVLCYPRLEVPESFAEQVARYVNAGGKLLVIDAPENEASTANDLLAPFGMQVDRTTHERGDVTTPSEWPGGVPVSSACVVTGGRPFILLNGKPVAAQALHGGGTVTVVGFGSRFVDSAMGITGDVEPNPDLRRVFDLQFALIRWIIEGHPGPPATGPADPPPATEPSDAALSEESPTTAP